MKKSPLSQLQERFESKEKLVETVKKLTASDLWLDRISPTKGLERVSNAKLVRLHDLLADAKQRFGSREKLIDSILALTKSVRDTGHRARLQAHPLPQLLDLHGSLSRKQGRAEAKQARSTKKKGEKRAPAKAGVAKKAVAKKAPAKKAPSRGSSSNRPKGPRK